MDNPIALTIFGVALVAVVLFIIFRSKGPKKGSGGGGRGGFDSHER